jgi:hypothetical protein
MKKLRDVLPWIFWIVVLLALTIAGTSSNPSATGAVNPRSYEQRQSTGGSSNPCQSSDVPLRSIRTSSGLRSPGWRAVSSTERHAAG